MLVLFIGDVVGAPGKRAIASALPRIHSSYPIDLVIANAENIADGKGVTPDSAKELFSLGVDVLTNGNHAWDKPEVIDYIVTEPRLLRPYNYPAGTPGSGWHVVTTQSGAKVGILNLLGNIFMSSSLSCLFKAADNALAQKPSDVNCIIVDVHAEVASEKIAMGWYLDGKVSAVVGTHTHVPTADECVLPKGTGYLTDVGMSGCYHSVVGMDINQSMRRLIDKESVPLTIAHGEGTLHAALLELDEKTGLCVNIQRLKMREFELTRHQLCV
ncbi:MAG: TIGR00282 family metallophosphoesterase [Thiohalophilus sp.]|uniref:TIGR00282 family metallophosphoesterase n=1 Tax=Thiohalophilus sp. TaxID=3028392 RepID=UPI00286FDC4C|nr:TIGR00282 family metallophosphoesterase [Thiohalophilus sp.]MDR9436948.1 TIGR00282 family metallophosphoesterase [Thiohalophilus sp.]